MFRLKTRLGENAFQKAAFEFLIIVTGVLVALAVDEWRQERAEMRELNQHLASLLDEVEQNMGTLEYIRVSLTQVKTPGLETVIAHLESGDESVDDPIRGVKELGRSADARSKTRRRHLRHL